MTDLFVINEGQRPSRVDLARQATAELPPTPELGAFQAQVAEAQGMPAFDWETLSKRAVQLEEEENASLTSQVKQPALAWYKRWQLWAPALAFAAVLIGLVPLLNPPDGPATRLKGDTELRFLLDGPDGFASGTPGQDLHPGDRIQFTFRAPLQQSIVLVGIDGTGSSAQYWPEEGDIPLSIPSENGLQLLSGSLELDTAPGPEVFVAVFGAGSVSEALELVGEAYDAGGHLAVQALRDQPGVSTLRVEKVP
ncbi:MAG: hypothetical protein ACI9VR_003725 [Cognaticolwellia sp.]|jgi:hypothetical protein